MTPFAPRKKKNATAESPAPLNGRFSSQIAFYTGDWGNRYLKGMKTGDLTSVTITDNTVVSINEQKWEQEKTRYRTSPSRYRNTELFGYYGRKKHTVGDKEERRWNYVAVGENARNYGRAKHMTDEIKYDYDSYWGAIVCSQLLRVFPNGHDHLVLGIAQPTKSFGQREMMVKSTLGKHRVRAVDGREITFIVHEVMVWDEPVGGVVQWGETSGNIRNYNLESGDMILVVDIGGGVTSFTRVQVDYDNMGLLQLLPIYDLQQSPSITMGQRNVIERFREVLKSSHPSFFTMKEHEITDRMLEEGIRTGQITLSATPVPVAEQLQFAEGDLLDQMENAFENNLAGGAPFKLIVDTGGGMHSYHNRLIAEMYNHPNVEPADELAEIHFANLKGGDEIFRQWIARQRTMGV